MSKSFNWSKFVKFKERFIQKLKKNRPENSKTNYYLSEKVKKNNRDKSNNKNRRIEDFFYNGPIVNNSS